MADQRISELFELTSSGTASNDELPIVDRSVSQTKKITVSGLVEAGFRTAADNSLPGSKLAVSGVTGAKIAAGAVGTAQLAATGVTAAKIADGAVGTTQLAATGVTTAKIADAAVTYAKLQDASANVVLGRTGTSGDVEEISCTAAGRALLDDADVAAQRATLGLGNIALGTGTWTDGASVSGTNTGDQTITLSGVITGTGTAGIETAFGIGVVNTSALTDGGITTRKIASGAITGEKLANDSSIVVSTEEDQGTGLFEGQGYYNSSSRKFTIWNGSSWGIINTVDSIAIETAEGVTSPLSFSSSLADNVNTITQDLNAQASKAVFAGPISGENAKPTFRSLEPTDLPKATNSAVGAVVPGSGLTIDSDGIIRHSNIVTAATYYKVSVDGNGHVASGSTSLEAADIPNLDASKITGGTFGSDFIATDAIDSDKIKDGTVCVFSETRGTGEFAGQLHYDPVNQDAYIWNGQAWFPLSVTTGEIVFAGLYDAGTNLIESLTGAGATISGATVSGALPSASGYPGYYFLVSASGTGTAPAPEIALIPPDLIVSDGTAWYEVDVSSSYVSQSASAITFTPTGTIAGTNVQTAIEEVNNEAKNAGNITSGTLAVARGGTNIASYVKGDLIVASGSTVLSKLAVGASGYVLTADSSQDLGVKWAAVSAGTVTTVSGTSPLSVSNPTTTPIISIANASTTSAGVVQLTNSTSTTSSGLAATATAVKSAYDIGAAALPKAGGTMTGTLTMASGQSIGYQGQGYTATISAATLTANRAISVPNASGTIVTTGATAIVSNAMVASGISAAKTDANFGDQDGYFYDVRIGRGAGAVSTNVAVGSGCLANHISGGGNTGLGRGALQSNTTGNGNTAIGWQSLLGSTSSADNTAVGVASLFGCNTGQKNTAIGRGALGNAASGIGNTAAGYNALASAAGTLNNVAIGSAAGGFISTGNYNVAIGSETLYGSGTYSLTGSRNIAIGHRSMYAASGAASDNIAIYSSGTPVFNVTTESNRIVMGATSATNAYVQVAWTVVSDERDKMNFKEVPHGIDFVKRLSPVAFQFRKSRESFSPHGPVRYGFKAQDILKLEGKNPVIIDNEDPDKLRYNGEALVPVLVNAIKELSSEIDSLKQEVALLKQS